MAVVLSALTFVHAWALERVDVKATYAVEQEVFDENWVKARLWREVWRVKGVVDLEEDPDYTREVRDAELPLYAKSYSKEKEASLRRKVYKPGSYTEYSWRIHPNMLESVENGRTFGYVEMRKRESGEAVDRWPLFISSRRVSPGLIETVHTTFATGGIVFRTTEIHSKTWYHLPVEKVEEVLGSTGEVLVRTKYKQIK